jgi:poly(3-hydroxybutyrate) depolymerase
VSSGVIAGALLVSGCGPPTKPMWTSADTLRTGGGEFVFRGSEGARRHPVPVWYYRPALWRRSDPVVIVMHGTGRSARGYRAVWAPYAEQYGFLLIAPEFSTKNYPGSAAYHHGNLVDRRGNAVDSARWTFTTVERIFDEVQRRTGSEQPMYRIYGHSAGSQFVHRMLLLMPGARVERAVVANAGWYTLPTGEEEYPYGLGAQLESPEWRVRLRAAFARDVSVLVGTADTAAADPDLRRTPRAMQQGPDRFARGHTFLDVARGQAARMHLPFRWRLATVQDAEHSNREMAGAAAAILGGDVRP